MTFDRRHRQLLEEGDKLFSDRKSLDILFQELALNLYPERADFTVKRALGEDFASNLDTSFPIIARRELSNQLGAMLRPRGKDWAFSKLRRGDPDTAGQQWLAMTDRVQRRALADLNSNFTRATKEADNDYATFGQAVLTSELARDPIIGAVLLHRTWHLRDVVWAENSFGKISMIQRNWLPGVRELTKFFKNVSPEVTRLAKEDPFKEIRIRHIIIASNDYEKKFRQPWVSIYIDTENQTVLEEIGSNTRHYIIPRWQTVSGSQYAYSPAAIAALPDARLLQAMTYTLLTAGEFAVEPAMIGVQEAIKGGIELFPGGFTAVDALYDERLGEVLRPIDLGGGRALPLGLAMNQDIREMLREAFFLSKLAMPPAGLGGMSPIEVTQRIEEFIRGALPLFEPVEAEYNGALMEQDFDILLRNGAFGQPQNIPDSLKGQETEFGFENPLQESIDRIKASQFAEAAQVVVQGAQLDPANARMVDWKVAQRDTLEGIGIPPDWMRSKDEVDQLAAQDQQAQATAGAIQTVQAGAQAAEQVGNAAAALAGPSEA